MGKYSTIKGLLDGLGHNERQAFFHATVVSVEDNTCTVTVDEMTIDGVRLKATTTQKENQVLMTPMIGTDVLIGSITGDLSCLVVLDMDEVDNIEITCKGQNVMMLLSQMIQTLASAQIVTPSGSGSFDPAVIEQLNTIETQFKEIFK